MSKARTLADFISDGSEFADGTISVAEVSGAAPLASPTFTGNVSVGDNVQIRLGDDDDLQLVHTGSHSYIQDVGTGNLRLRGTDVRIESNTGYDMLSTVDAAGVTLYYANTPKLATASDGVDITGNINLADNGKAVFGDSDDLQIYHNGLGSYITENGTGSLFISGTNMWLKSSGGDTYILCNDTTDTVSLYQANAKKLETSSTGVDITGEVKADKFTNDEALPDIRPALLFDFANSKSLDPRVEFYRETSATYWDGKSTTKAEENLLAGSQTYSNTNWNYGRFSIAQDATAPDGTTTAWTFTQTDVSSGGYLKQTPSQNVAAIDHTLSFYIKYVDWEYITLRANNNANDVVFNINAGTVVDTSNVGSAITSWGIEDAGNGWKRIHITGPYVAYNFHLYLTDSTGSNAVSALDSTFLLWGAQLEMRSNMTSYLETTSTPITKYQPTLQTVTSSTPRFDHDPVTGESKGLLIEEGRVNLENNSTGGFSYVGAGSSITTNYAIAPDGTNTATYLKAATATGTKVFDHYGQTASTTPHTYSVFIKAYGYNRVGLEYLASGGFAENARFNLSDGTVYQSSSGATGHIQEIGNGWYRIAVTCTPTSTASDIQRIFILDNSGNSSFAGDGFSGLLAWGYQNETGSFPTSYIPTSGATKTRSADIAKIATANILSTVEGTIYAESISGPTGWDAASQYNIFHYGDDNQNGYGVFKESGSKDFWFHLRKDNGSIFNVSNGTDWTSNLTSKVVIGFDNSTQAYYVDGNQIGGTQTYNMGQLRHANITELNIGSSGSGAYFNGHIKKLSAYNERLTNATMQAMTE